MYKYILLFFFASCATPKDLIIVPRLENRTLKISPDRSGFTYKYEDPNGKCLEKKLFGCKRRELKVDFYDMNDKSVREKLIQGQFELRSKLQN